LQKTNSFEIISIFTEKYTKKDFSVQENGGGFTHYLHFVRFFRGIFFTGKGFAVKLI